MVDFRHVYCLRWAESDGYLVGPSRLYLLQFNLQHMDHISVDGHRPPDWAQSCVPLTFEDQLHMLISMLIASI